ncbi:MAG: GGDEF domain-containing protein [Candidatus Omnitrophota bacterium]
MKILKIICLFASISILMFASSLGYNEKYYINFMISFMLFYSIPVVLMSWAFGRFAGIAAAVVSIIFSMLADLNFMPYKGYIFIPYCNAAVRMVFFLIIVFAMEFKNLFEKERQQRRIDQLTGINNRQYFYELANREIERCRRYKHPFTLAFLDCDNFKYINDHFGHQAGDVFLRKLASSMNKNIRKTDVVARLGGDEFVVLLIETDLVSSKMIIDRFKSLIFNTIHENKLPVTFSIGVVSCLEAPSSVDELIKRADELMYSAKKSGKNTIKFDEYKALPEHKKCEDVFISYSQTVIK